MPGAAVYRVRPQRREDTAAVLAVVAAAFGPDEPGVPALVRALEHDSAGRAGATLVAETGDVVVGHVALSRGWVDAPERLVEVQVVSPLSVAPDHQGRGVGARLVLAALRAAERLGAPMVVLEGDPGYYARLGFEPAAMLGLTRPSTRIPEPACQVALLGGHEPWMRGAIVYPDVFWRLDLVGLRGDQLAEAERRLGSTRAAGGDR
jgi:putative acetyltransferase